MNARKCIFIALTASLLFAVHVNAALTVVEHSFSVDSVNQEVDFFLTFSESPDFFTVDAFGRQADSFQYYFDADAEMTLNGGTQQHLAERIIRGAEIPIEGNLRIREREGNDPDPNSGGWGPIVGTVDYLLVDEELSFTVPWAVLGEDDGIFTYSLQLVEFGSTTDVVVGGHIPVPATVWLFGCALMSLLGLRASRSPPPIS